MWKQRSKRFPGQDYADYYEEEGPGRGGNRDRKSPREGTGQGTGPRIRKPSALIHLTVLAGIGLLLLGLVWMAAGWLMLEMTLKALVAPLGLIWLGLLLTLYFCLLNRQGLTSCLVLACWLLLTAGGNSLVHQRLVHSLQDQYAAFDVDRLEPLDIVLVLGGGQGTTPAGQPQLASAGDRAMLAARLLLKNRTARILCSGTSSLPLRDGELTQADALERLLLDLNVPADRILKIGGRNTLQEIQAFDRWIADNRAGELGKGIVTSAWHLPRAMRLARTAGIQAEPIPADFTDTRFRQTPNLLIPGADHLAGVTRALKEYLAGLAGR